VDIPDLKDPPVPLIRRARALMFSTACGDF
jgi:hypothetical protein